MEPPALLALDEDEESLRLLENQLVQRYVHDYRVECFLDPNLAASRLSELSRLGEQVALGLAAKSDAVTASGGLLEQVRGLHPHAKCALLVPGDVWADKSNADTIRASIALG